MIRAARGRDQQLHQQRVSPVSAACLMRADVSGPGARGGRTESGTHPVQHVRPALHGDALEHGQHGEQEVVEVGDAAVGALPAFSALGAVDGALAPVP